MSLPRGMWYERDRDRYRIRLYLDGRVEYLRYCESRTAADQAMVEGKKYIASLRKVRSNGNPNQLHSVDDQLKHLTKTVRANRKMTR